MQKCYETSAFQAEADVAYEQVNNKEIDIRNVGFAFLKPGFQSAEEAVARILEAHSLQILCDERLILNPDMVDFIYRGSQYNHYYPVMREYLCKNEITALLIVGPSSDTRNVLSRLKRLPDGKDGILRQSLQTSRFINNSEIEQWCRQEHPNQDQMTILLTQSNVIHTCDNEVETTLCIKSIFGHKLESHKRRGSLPIGLMKFTQELLSTQIDLFSSEATDETGNISTTG